MDYAIYKTIDNGRPTVIKRFTQQDCNHRAKLAARRALNDMWYHYIQHHMTSANTKEHVRYFIDYL